MIENAEPIRPLSRSSTTHKSPFTSTTSVELGAIEYDLKGHLVTSKYELVKAFEHMEFEEWLETITFSIKVAKLGSHWVARVDDQWGLGISDSCWHMRYNNKENEVAKSLSGACLLWPEVVRSRFKSVCFFRANLRMRRQRALIDKYKKKRAKSTQNKEVHFITVKEET